MELDVNILMPTQDDQTNLWFGKVGGTIYIYIYIYITDSNWRRFKQSLFIRSCSNHFVGLFLLQHAPGAKF